MNHKEIIEQALAQGAALTFEDIAKIAGYTDTERQWAQIFWDSAFNSSWIYLSDDAIINWMGYEINKDTISNFNRRMVSSYTKDVVYKEVEKTHPLVKKYFESHSLLITNGNRKKYYIVTGHTFKKMLMKANTAKGNETEQLAELTYFF